MPRSGGRHKGGKTGQPRVNKCNDRYSHSTSADLWICLSKKQRIIELFRIFHKLVTDYQIDPKEVHQAFLEINEYRKIIVQNIALPWRAGGYLSIGRDHFNSRC